MLDPLGARFQVPSGTQLIHRPTATEPHLLLRDGGARPSWSLRAEVVRPPEGSLGPAMAVLHGNEVLAKADPDAILYQGTRRIDGRHAHEAWIGDNSASGAPVTLGWLAVPRRDGQVMLFTAVTTPAMLPQSRPVIEAIFDSITPIDTGQAKLMGSMALESTAERFKNALPAALHRLEGLRRVIRIWQPGDGGAGGSGRELAFGIITAEAGTADQIHPADSAAAFGGTAPEGLLVTVHLRFAVDPARDRYLDQIMRSWIAWDSASEQWYLNATRKQRGLQNWDSELGFRTEASVGQPRPTLMVIREGGAGDRSEFNNPVPPGWLPRGLEWLVHDVLPGQHGETAMWAAWDPSGDVPRMLLRRDHWTAVPDGTFIVRTWQGMDGLPSISRVTPSGPAFTDRPDGTRIEIVDDERIAALWRAAGLKLR